jgi:murein DD-endopeptidase MepM/ murein hydrolase activator NlpD
MSEAVDALTQKVNTLNSAVSSTASTAQSAFGSVLNGVAAQGGQLQLGSTNTNMMPGSLAPFSTQTPAPTSMTGAAGGGTTGMSGAGAPPSPPSSGPAAAAAGGGGGNRLTGALAKVGGIDPSTLAQGAGILQAGIGVAQMALAPVAGAYAAAMPTGQIVDSATSYYQATLRAPGMSRSAVENATFSAMQGGMTSVGSPAIVSNILSNSGFMPGTSQYMQAAQQVSLAAQNYGIDNSAAANSITSMSQMGIANNLFNVGIATLDANGNQLSMGDITKQLMNRLYPNGVNPAGLNRSIQYGSFQNQLAQFGITDQTTQQLITGNAMDIASGKNPNAVNNNANNANPLNAIMSMNQSQTGILQGSEANALSGLQTAAGFVKQFNDTMGPIIESMAKYRAILEGGLSTNAGQGIKAGVSTFFSGIKNVVGGLSQAAMAVVGGGGTPGYGGTFGGPKGGGTPGYGSNISGPKGGGTPSLNGMSSTANPMISAPYGATDSSGIWSSTGNQHQGVDYAVPSGTPVRATKDGIVSGKILSADYGQAVLLEHKDGWSSIYAHLSNKEVSIGSQVLAGDEIGKSGASGNTTGPSVHYEVWKGDNNPVDPASLPGAFNSPIASGSLADVGSAAGPKAVNPNAGTAGDQEFAKALLSKAGINATDTNISALTTWMHWEGGTSNNAFNPLNTTLDAPGATNFNSVGVKSYTSLGQGVDATYNTLTGQSADKRGYTAILNDLKNNAPLDQFVSDVNHSSWGTHVKGGGTPGAGTTISNGSSGGGTINNVSISLSIAHASDSEAHLFAKKVKEILANDHNVLAIGSS